MIPQTFINWLAPAAQAQCKCYDLPPSVVIAQAAIESGWGQYTIGQYNLFGRKWNGTGEYIEKWTQEWDGSQMVDVLAKFQDYPDLLHAIDDWCILMTQEPVYANAWGIWCNTHDVNQFVRAMGQIYATDPDYADKVITTIQANNLTQFD